MSNSSLRISKATVCELRSAQYACKKANRPRMEANSTMAAPAASTAAGAASWSAVRRSKSCAFVQSAGSAARASIFGSTAGSRAAGIDGSVSSRLPAITPCVMPSRMLRTSRGTASCESVAITINANGIEAAFPVRPRYFKVRLRAPRAAGDSVGRVFGRFKLWTLGVRRL